MPSPYVQCYDCGRLLPSEMSVPCEVCLWKAPQAAGGMTHWVWVDMCPPCAREHGGADLAGLSIVAFLLSAVTCLVVLFLRS